MVSSSLDQLADELFDFFTRVAKATSNDTIDVITELELSIPQCRVLFMLEGAPAPPALHELIAAIGLSLAGASRTVDALVRAGLVSRREDERDRRVKRVALTAAGRGIVERIMEARRDALRELVAMLDEDERAAFSAALRPVLARRSAQRGPGGPGNELTSKEAGR